MTPKPTTDFLEGHELVVYSTAWCPDCTRLKRWLEVQGVGYTDVDIEAVPGAAERLERETGKRAIPFILVDGRTWVRGYHTEERTRLSGDRLVAELQEAVGTPLEE